jgi:hypothetical protein
LTDIFKFTSVHPVKWQNTTPPPTSLPPPSTSLKTNYSLRLPFDARVWNTAISTAQKSHSRSGCFSLPEKSSRGIGYTSQRKIFPVHVTKRTYFLHQDGTTTSTSLPCKKNTSRWIAVLQTEPQIVVIAIRLTAIWLAATVTVFQLFHIFACFYHPQLQLLLSPALNYISYPSYIPTAQIQLHCRHTEVNNIFAASLERSAFFYVSCQQ